MKRQNLKFPQIKGPVSLNYSMDKELSQLFADTMDYISPSEEYKLHSDKYLSYYRYRAIQYLVDENIKKKYDARGSRDADKLADQLAAKAGLEIPEAVSSIRHAPVRHNTVVEVPDMEKAVKNFLNM
jgi:hypothetical protein